MKQRQNIVFFFSDQQRADTLGCNGQTLPVTPRLDRFACEDAVNFASAFTPQPVCGPARAMLQTGLYPTQTGCYRNAVSLPLNQKTLARYLREAGYRREARWLRRLLDGGRCAGIHFPRVWRIHL